VYSGYDSSRDGFLILCFSLPIIIFSYFQGADISITSGTLWSSSGSSLASVNFSPASGATAGWAEASFTSPVAITANTAYTISYFTPAGR
jgi:hypothetical protein